MHVGVSILWKWGSTRTKKSLGSDDRIFDKDPPHVALIDGKEYADKRSARRARDLAGSKKPSPSIDGKEYAEDATRRNRNSPGLKKPSPSIDGKEHAG